MDADTNMVYLYSIIIRPALTYGTLIFKIGRTWVNCKSDRSWRVLVHAPLWSYGEIGRLHTTEQCKVMQRFDLQYKHGDEPAMLRGASVNVIDRLGIIKILKKIPSMPWPH